MMAFTRQLLCWFLSRRGLLQRCHYWFSGDGRVVCKTFTSFWHLVWNIEHCFLHSARSCQTHKTFSCLPLNCSKDKVEISEHFDNLFLSFWLQSAVYSIKCRFPFFFHRTDLWVSMADRRTVWPRTLGSDRSGLEVRGTEFKKDCNLHQQIVITS